MMRTEDDNKYSTFYGYVPHMQNDRTSPKKLYTFTLLQKFTKRKHLPKFDYKTMLTKP